MQFQFPIKHIGAILLCFVVLPISLFSQDIEQLKYEARHLRDKEKVEAYLQIGIISSEKYAQADSLLKYAELADQSAMKIKFTAGHLNAQLHRGIAFQQMNIFDSSQVILERVIKDARKSNSNALLGDAHFYLGLSYYRGANNSKAIQSYLAAIKVYKKLKNLDGLALTYTRLVGLFNNESQAKEAKNYLYKTLRLLPSMQRPYPQITVYSAISGAYIQLNAESPTYLDSSIYFAQKALRMMKEFDYMTKANQICNSIADAYYLKKDYENALAYCTESLNYRRYLFPGEIIISYLKYSDCANAMENHQMALLYLDSVQIALKQIDDDYYRMVYFERVYQFNKDAGNYAAAMTGLEHYKSIQDSLFNLEKSASINELLNKYNKVEDEKKIADLSRQNEINSLNVKILVVGIASALLLLLVLVFFFRQSRLKNKFEILQSEQRLNRARIEPHFFFNALTSIQTNAMMEHSPKTVSLLSKFSKIMRQSLESTYDEMLTLEDEIAFIEQYLDLQLIRHEKPFAHDIEVDDAIDSSFTLVPAMLLQPLIENSIEHGFGGDRSDYALRIEFKASGNELQITVLDNGDTGKTEQSTAHTSRATQIMKDRLFLLEKLTKKRTAYTLTSRKEGGYQVEIWLPLMSKSSS